MLSWPHHRAALQGANFVSIEYSTVKGPMIGVLGNEWVQRFELPSISFRAEAPIHDSCRAELEQTLEQDVAELNVLNPGKI
jgi:hypothetical protein